MTIPSYDNRRSYAGNGSTNAFAFPPPFTANTDLVVQIQAADGTIATKALGVDYTVSGAGTPASGSVTMTVAPAAGTTLIIYRDVPITQSVDLQDGGPLPANTINRALDRVTMWGQRLKEQVVGLGTLASQTAAGLMSAADKAKLDGVEPGAQVNTVTSVAGRTGAVSLAKGDVGLANVDNTSDFAKPISSAQQAALDAKASRASNLSDLTNAAAARINLGGGATGISIFQAANSSSALTAIGATETGSSLVAAANTSAARTILGLVPGTDVQAYSARLAEIAGTAWAQGDILYFNGTSLARLPAGTAGQFFRTGGPSGTPDWVSIAGGGDMLRANNLSDVADPATARMNLGAIGTSSPTVTDTLTVSGAATQTINLNSAGNAFQLAIQTNGTANISAYTANRPINYAVASGGSHVFYVDGSAYLTVDATGLNIPTGAAYKINGTAFSFSNLAGSAAANQGGTGQTSYAVGDLLYASGNAALSKLADVAAGSALISGGVGAAPSWGKIGLTTHISGTLAIANGGTNINTYATGDILYASAANTLAKLGIGTTGQTLTVVGGAPIWATVASTWPTGTLFGLTLSQASAAMVGIAAGGCANEDGGITYNMTLASAITKGLGAWAAGTGNGGLDTGSIAANTWYHVHFIRKDSDGSIDALLSLTATAPTMPAGYTARRRLGSIRTNGSSQIVAFVQQGARFIWDVPIVDVSTSGPGTAAVTRTLTVPTGVVVEADIIISVMQQSGVVPAALVSPLAVTDTAPGTATSSPLDGPFQATSLTAGGYWTSAPTRVATNTSAQVRSRLSASGASVRFGIVTLGWVDTRGAN